METYMIGMKVLILVLGLLQSFVSGGIHPHPPVYGVLPCPDDDVVACLVNPCEVTSCAKIPKAVCKADYCKGCNARYFVGTKEVTHLCCNLNDLPRASCPPGVPVFNCLVDPCSLAICPKFTSAKCRSDFCGGCFARFFRNGKEVTDQCKVNRHTGQYKMPQIDCPPKDVWHCLFDPCETFKCPRFPKANCRADFCRGCNARYYIGSSEVTKKCHEKPIKNQCPPGKPPVFCFVEPCRVATCPRFPNARCEDDFCGGCNARWFIGDVEVTKKCEREKLLPKPKCPSGDIWYCIINPCESFKCPNYPNAHCKPDYCRGCNARFYVNGNEVTKKCHVNPNNDICPPDKPVVNCFVEPCRFSTCPRHPNARCFDDYCGGCFARWYIGRSEVTDSCFKKPDCPYGMPKVYCEKPPCHNAICRGYPNAKCLNDYCGGCIARWYEGKKEVTQKCKGGAEFNPCPIGKPLHGYFCGRGQYRKDCPVDYFCKTDPVDRYAVCCKEYVPPPMPQPPPQAKQCPLGSAVTNGTGERIVCNPHFPKCPKDTTCVGGSAKELGSCCRNTNLCKTGKPFVTNGDAPACRGPNAIRCPAGFTCKNDANPLSSVCCPENTGPKCPMGNPLPNIFCGRGPNRQDCPSGYFCNIDPADRFAVCCKKPLITLPPPPQFRMCPFGSVVDKPGGKPLVCFPFRPVTSPPQCPKGSQCKGGPADQPGQCCLKKNICKHGKPFAPSGNALPCQGPNAIRCPASFQCKVSSKPLASVCCPRAPPFIPKCKYGKYFKDLGQKPSCNPLASIACPPGYVCSGTPTDGPGFCCRRKNPCKKGKPLQKNGDALNCIGPGKIDCPTGYKCVGSATTSSVCCRKRKTTPFRKCPLGSVVDKPGGKPLVCSQSKSMSYPPQCPKGSKCIGGPAGQPGQCCLKKNICKHGKPFAPSGNALPCRGPNAIRCPASFQCTGSSKPLVSVCCPRAPPFVPKCKYGKYFKDLGQTPSCNPLASTACPQGYECSGTATDGPGFCCRKKNPCKKGIPLHKNGDALNCIGPGKIDCPTGYKCVGSATTFSVCCRKGGRRGRG